MKADEPIAEGYCQCGCGGKAPIARHGRTKLNIMRGQVLKFIKGHNAKKMYLLRTEPAPSDHKWGIKNHNWKGDRACIDSGRHRAQRKFNLGLCEKCGNPARRRHHKDRNPLNNNSENVQILCAKCHCKTHMEEDGKYGFIKPAEKLENRHASEKNQTI